METAAKIHATPANKSVANTVTGGKSMPAVPVLQQKPKEQEEKPQMIAAPDRAPVTRFAARAGLPPDDNAKRTPFTLQMKEMTATPSPDDSKNLKPFTLQMKETEALPTEPLTRFNPVQKKENNTGMPDNLKTGIENMSGYDMSDVRVHYNSDKPAQLQALAFAQGADIHVAPGQERHLPHEVDGFSAFPIARKFSSTSASTVQRAYNCVENSGPDSISRERIYTHFIPSQADQFRTDITNGRIKAILNTASPNHLFQTKEDKQSTVKDEIFYSVEWEAQYITPQSAPPAITHIPPVIIDFVIHAHFSLSKTGESRISQAHIKQTSAAGIYLELQSDCVDSLPDIATTSAEAWTLLARKFLPQ